MYFSLFPTAPYTQPEANTNVTRTMTNLLARVQLRELLGNLDIPWVWYDVPDHERPDTIASKYYGSPDYTWLVLIANDIRDTYDWPMDERQFQEYLTKVYGSVSAAKQQIVYYKNAAGLNIDQTTWNTLSITQRSTLSAYDQEVAVNEAVRRIRLIPKSMLPIIERQLTQVLGTQR